MTKQVIKMTKQVINMNRLANVDNRFQTKAKRVLCICSAGLLRSPTTAVVLAREPFNFNTRAAGIVEEYALIPVDEVLIAWADEIVCMENSHALMLKNKFNIKDKNVTVLNIPDHFQYMDPELVEMISKKYNEPNKEI